MAEELFDGDTIIPERDGERLIAQMQRVRDVMNDENWHSLFEISDITGDPPQSISARIRDLRKVRFGGHIVERRYIRQGLFEYRKVS